jgi:hypothetical protein
MVPFTIPLNRPVDTTNGQLLGGLLFSDVICARRDRSGELG